MLQDTPNQSAGTAVVQPGTGLDQIVQRILSDLGLAGNIRASEIKEGAAAAAGINALIIEAAAATGASNDARFTAEEVVAINGYIRTNHYDTFVALHGDDEDGVETGFHLVQNDGATTEYRGLNFVDTVADGIYHIGFEIVDGRFRNEDGDANACVQDVADWLTQLYTDRSTSETGLDRIPDLIIADPGLANCIEDTDIFAGADAANGINLLIAEAIAATGAADDNWIDADDVLLLNAYIRENHYEEFVRLHGDDEDGVETGFHLVQNDGAMTKFFGKNLVDTIADGIYHIGFEIREGRFLNEDGNANATVADVASWINYFYSDLSSTGTGLDWIVDIIKLDRGLSARTKAADINDGALAADGLNAIVAEAIAATGADEDTWITATDIVAINAHIRANHLDEFTRLHGDDENGQETGFHKVQNDGATTTFFDRNLVNTIADGIYHLGFEIENGRLLNEDGNANATLEDVAAWLNFFHGGHYLIYGTSNADAIEGTDEVEQIIALGGNDCIFAGGGGDLVQAGTGSDTVDGGEGDDLFLVSGNLSSRFEGFDIYADTSGSDTIEAVGESVDIGLKEFGPKSGIEVIDATKATGAVRVIGDSAANVFDFSATALLGKITIDLGSGNDTATGSAGDDILRGGKGNDLVDGGLGDDQFLVSGNLTAQFEGYDIYADSGGLDSIIAVGEAVDIGLKEFGPKSGIETIDATGATGAVRVLGDSAANLLDFSAVALLGRISIDLGSGNDTAVGSAGNDTIRGGKGNDLVDGGEGDDQFLVSGNLAAQFEGYDAYLDAAGSDAIVALGESVDIGLREFGPKSGIDTIDATGAAGEVRVVGDSAANVLDFSGVDLLGRITIDLGSGNDTVNGSAGNDTIRGGKGNDFVDGNEGDDRFLVSGNLASQFEGYDTYADAAGVDTIAAVGESVDIGLKSFGPKSGIEAIDSSGATGTVRILGDSAANAFDFSTTEILGVVTFDGGSGNDTIIGSASSDRIIGGKGNDLILGGAGADSLTGGDGRDQFRFVDAAEGGDQVSDFVRGSDRIEVLGSAFGGLQAGQLSAANFARDQAGDENDFFVFETATRILFYDADGNGAGAGIALVGLNVFELASTDIYVVA